MTAVTICDTREKLQNCPFIAKKGKNIAKKGKYDPSSAFDSVTICDHCDQLVPPHTASYHIIPHLGAPGDTTPRLLYRALTLPLKSLRPPRTAPSPLPRE